MNIKHGDRALMRHKETNMVFAYHVREVSPNGWVRLQFGSEELWLDPVEAANKILDVLPGESA